MGEKVSTYISREALQERTRDLGRQITRDYAGRNLILISILKGSVVFLTDLMREIESNTLEIDFMVVSSYGRATASSGDVRIIKDLSVDIKGKDVLIVEDILDSGNTLSKVMQMLSVREPNSLNICALLDKPSRRIAQVPLTYTGFVIPDEFIVGYGLDYAEHYRNLPYIGTLEFTED